MASLIVRSGGRYPSAVQTGAVGRRGWIALGCLIVAGLFGAVWLWRSETAQSYTAGTTHGAILEHANCVWEVNHGRFHWMANAAVMPKTWGPSVRGRLHIISDSQGGTDGGGAAEFEAHGVRIDMVGGRDFLIAVACNIENAN